MSALSDPYVRKNIHALDDVASVGTTDSRIAAALCRRGLIWEQPKDRWHLTAAGSQVLREFHDDDSA